jgi:hypothetical protein
MSTILHVPNPDRVLTDVVIEGWPIILTKGIVLGYLPVCAHHPLNVTNRDEIHISYTSYYALTTLIGTYERLAYSLRELRKL